GVALCVDILGRTWSSRSNEWRPVETETSPTLRGSRDAVDMVARTRKPDESRSAGPIRPDRGIDLARSIKDASVANERLLAATARGLIRTISDPESPTIIKVQLVYATLCVLSFSICSMFF